MAIAISKKNVVVRCPEIDYKGAGIQCIITEKLSVLDNSIDSVLYEPKYKISHAEHSATVNMTEIRAILLKTFQDLELYFGGSLTHLCMQKTVYFLEQLHYDYGAKFAKNKSFI